jgi:hypothetical protein
MIPLVPSVPAGNAEQTQLHGDKNAPSKTPTSPLVPSVPAGNEKSKHGSVGAKNAPSETLGAMGCGILGPRSIERRKCGGTAEPKYIQECGLRFSSIN